MLPGKTYTPEDVLRIARKRIWFLLLPLALVSAATAVWAKRLPNRYRSEMSILVVPQRVPEAYIRSTVTSRIEDRLQTMTAEILSRTQLERIITDLNLYAEELAAGEIMQDVVEKMQRDIKPEVLRGDAFRISYVGENPGTVMKVTEKLGTLFINASNQDRSRVAEGTNQFLEGQLEDAKRRLQEHEKRVEEYRKKFAGQLPSQLESNLDILQSKQAQLQQTADGVNRERDRQIRLERDIADLETQIEESESASMVMGDGTTVDTAAKRLDAAREALATMLLTMKDTHPDVKKMKAAIAELEAKVKAEAKAPEDTPVSPDPRRMSPVDAARRKRLDELKLELTFLKRNITNGENDQERLRKEITSYQQRNEAIPTRESEMAELMRDYTTHQSLYVSLLGKREESKMSTEMERRSQGEQFRILDQARTPEKPYSPNRLRLNLMGFLGGLGLGVLLIALLEYRDRSFKTDEEVTQLLTLPVLAVVPFMQSAAEKKRAFRIRLLMGLAFGATVLGCLVVVVLTLVKVN